MGSVDSFPEVNIHLVLSLRMSETTHVFPIGLRLHVVYRDSFTLFFYRLLVKK